MGRARACGGRNSPSAVQEQSPARGSGEEVSKKLKQNVKSVYNFNVFMLKIRI